MKVEDLIAKYYVEKIAYDTAKTMLDKKKADLDETKSQIRSTLDEMGLKSAKTDLGTASIAKKRRMILENEAKVIQWLKDEPTIEHDLYVKLDKRGVEPLIKQWSEQTGEIVEGVVYEDSEYLSIKAAK